MVWTDGIIGGLFTYILFWTLVYAVVGAGVLVLVLCCALPLVFGQ